MNPHSSILRHLPLLRSSATLVPLLGIAMIAAGCGISDPEEMSIDSTGRIEFLAYLDANGNGRWDEGDPRLPGVPVAVRFPTSTLPVAGGRTGAEGTLLLDSVPVGAVLASIESAFFGDTLQTVEDPGRIIEMLADSAISMAQGATYPHVEMEDLGEIPLGRRVFTVGIALNSREPFGDGVVHLEFEDAALRATRVDRVGVGPGDSVRIEGRVRRQEGRITLDSARIFVLQGQVTRLTPIAVTSGEAGTARRGELDARLVEVREAEIVRVRSAGNDLLLETNDGSGRVDLLLRDYHGFDPLPLREGATVVRGTGLLRPDGTGRWVLHPRNTGDLVVRPATSPAG